MKENLEFKKQREFGEVITDTFQFIKQNFKPLLKVFVYLCGFFILASMLSAIVNLINMKDVVANPSNPRAQLDKIFTVAYFLNILFYFLTFTAITVSTLCYISLYVEKHNNPPSVEEVWSYFKYFFLRVLGSSIPNLLAMVVAFAACIIPGIYVFPALTLIYTVMIFENGSFAYSFRRAFKLANLDWWLTAATMLIIFVITYAAMLIPSIPSIVVSMATAFTPGSQGPNLTGMIIGTVIQYLFQFIAIFPLVGISFIYFNLVEKLENSGLLGRIQQMGETKDPHGSPEEY